MRHIVILLKLEIITDYFECSQGKRAIQNRSQDHQMLEEHQIGDVKGRGAGP